MNSATDVRRKRTFKSFQYKGVELDDLLKLSNEEFVQMCGARVRRRFARGIDNKPTIFMNKLRAAKLATQPNEKPAVVKTHLRNMIVLPEMIGSVVGIYNGKVFNIVEIKPEMVGHYLGEFSITYNPVQHGKASAGSSKLRLY